MDRRLIDSIVSSGTVSRADMQRYILRATKNKVSVLREIFEDHPESESIAKVVASHLGAEFLPPDALVAQKNALALVAAKSAENAALLPLSFQDDTLVVAVADIESASDLLNTVKLATGNAPEIKISAYQSLKDAIAYHYFGKPWKFAQSPAKPAPEPPDPEPDSEDIIDLNDLVAPPKIEPDEAVMRAKPKRRPSLSSPQSFAGSEKLEKPKSPTVEVNQALEDFDAFLDTNSTGQFATDDSWEEEFYKSQGQSGFGSQFGESEDELNAIQGFDLFEPSEIELTIQELVDRHEAQIQKLQQELKNQRDVVAVLVEMLHESRVLNRKELSKRVKARRG